MKHFHRSLALLLAFVLCLFLPVPLSLRAEAASTAPPCRVVKTDITLGATRYVVYEYAGRRYNSIETSPGTNYAAWQQFSDADKRKVSRHFAGFNDQLKAQYSGADAILEFANENSGWAKAGEVLRKRLAGTHYPALEAFYGDPDAMNYSLFLPDLDMGARSGLSSEEQAAFDKERMELSVIYDQGFSAYRKLVELKQKQLNAAVTSISKDLVTLILDNACPTAPSGSADDIADLCYDYLDSLFGISDKIKRYTGLGKLSGETEAVSADDAAKVIELFWQLMQVQETYATSCMNKLKPRLTQFQTLYESDLTLSETRREQEAAKREAEYRARYEEAVHYNVALLDYDPSISVDRSQYGTEEAYLAACLAAAKEWAAQEARSAEEGLRTLWQSYNPSGNPKEPGDPAYYNDSVWFEYSGNAKVFFRRCFSDYMDYIDELYGYEHTFYGYRGELMSANSIVFSSMGEEVLPLIERGYDNAIAALRDCMEEVEAWGAAWDAIQTEFQSYAIPYRNRMYNLSTAHCTWEDEGYGNWGVSDETFNRFQSQYESYYEALEQDEDALLDRLQQEIDKLETDRQFYLNEIERERLNAKPRYEIYAYAQDRLDYGFWLYMKAARELDALKAGYPDWLKEARPGYSFLAGGVVAAYNGIESERLYQEFFRSVPAVMDRYEIMETQLLPLLRDWDEQERELIAELDRAKGIIDETRKELRDRKMYFQDVAAINRMGFGQTLKTLTEMMDDFGYTAYESGETPRPVRTTAIAALLADLSGESPYMNRIRAIHAEMLEQRGDLLRRAKDGTLRNTKEYHGLYFDDYYYKNGTDSQYTSGVYGDAHFRSYTSWSVWNYWYENIYPFIQLLDKVLYGSLDYRQVTDLVKGAALLDENDLTLAPGQTAALRVTVKPEDATLPDVIWHSENEDVATVNDQGVVRALLPGTTVITATAADSPSDEPLFVSFTVRVEADGHESLEDYGVGRFYLGAEPKLVGQTVQIRGTLYWNQEDCATAAALVAIYDGNRFLGCGAVERCELYPAALVDLDMDIPLSAAPDGTLTVKVFLIDRETWGPAADPTSIC